MIGRTNSSSGVSSELNDETIDDDIYESINEDTYLQTSEQLDGQASAIPLENSSVTQNATQSVTENVTPSMMKPVPQLVTQPVSEAITEPDPAQSDEYESTTNVITEPDLENDNLTQIMEKPVAQPIIQPITQPITQANTEFLNQPIAQSDAEPGTQPAIQSVAQRHFQQPPVTQPLIQSFPKPMTETMPEPSPKLSVGEDFMNESIVEPVAANSDLNSEARVNAVISRWSGSFTRRQSTRSQNERRALFYGSTRNLQVPHEVNDRLLHRSESSPSIQAINPVHENLNTANVSDQNHSQVGFH